MKHEACQPEARTVQRTNILQKLLHACFSQLLFSLSPFFIVYILETSFPSPSSWEGIAVLLILHDLLFTNDHTKQCFSSACLCVQNIFKVSINLKSRIEESEEKVKKRSFIH